MKQARQGDVLFEQVSSIPSNLKKRGNNVVAYGEATGHAHRLESNTAVLFDGEGAEKGDMFLDSSAPATVEHEEHPTVNVPKGKFKITIQREYDSIAAERERKVID